MLLSWVELSTNATEMLVARCRSLYDAASAPGSRRTAVSVRKGIWLVLISSRLLLLAFVQMPTSLSATYCSTYQSTMLV
jgi:hypothetical protein